MATTKKKNNSTRVRQHTSLLCATIAGLLLQFSPISAHAGLWEKLIMPGELIQSHATLEEDCENCHLKFDKSEQRQLCLSCHDHKNIQRDIDNQSGFHGKIHDIQSVECKTCHSDHQGREFQSASVSSDIFDHNNTDFVLENAHLGIQCKACHKKENKFSDAGTSCISCHREDEPHEEKLGEECDYCHTTQTWVNIHYDHSETEFPLTGEHEQTKCVQCHIDEHYSPIDVSCSNCHTIDDVHINRFGDSCADCHSTKDWTYTEFDHTRDTDFKLAGPHKNTGCKQCHFMNADNVNIDTSCVSCHQEDDTHIGRNGNECQTCHTGQTWQENSFDHDKDTDFKLEQAHTDLTCVACHFGSVETTLPGECVDCHSSDDVHKESLGSKCANCHNQQQWLANVFFEHDLTSFPLIGLHATVPCSECHLSNQFDEASDNCIDCHQSDDYHEELLGSNCNQCHTPNSWTLWLFDHGKATDFGLDGAHIEITCESCHKQNLTENNSVDMPSQCYDCHQKEDVHDREFGIDCAKCHSTTNFTEVTIDE